MSSLKAIIQALKEQAYDNEARAFAILGARPGPGIDLLIHPVEPLCGQWNIDGLTEAGRRWIDKFWPDRPIKSNQHLDQLKREARDWSLKYEIRYPIQAI